MNRNDLIKKVELYKCDYCEVLHKTREEATECLNNHNIVFRIEYLKADHDCWGKSSCYWSSTDKLFKTYEDALKYIGNKKDYRIILEELL